MSAITICSDFGAQKNKVSHCFPICHEVMGPDAMILVFWLLSFKPTFSLSKYELKSLLFGEGNGNPQPTPRDGGAWWAVVYGVAQSQTQLKWLSSKQRTILYKWLNCLFTALLTQGAARTLSLQVCASLPFSLNWTNCFFVCSPSCCNAVSNNKLCTCIYKKKKITAFFFNRLHFLLIM